MKISAIVPWFGSKRTLASAIVEQLGEHSAYWEPFCGSMAVLFKKQQSSHETVNDLNGDITNLAWILQSPQWTELYDRCLRSILCDGIFDEACARVKAEAWENGDKPDLERAYWFFVKSWWGRNGVVGAKGIGSSLAVRFTPGGGHGGIRFRSTVDSMTEWHERLRSVLVLRRDAFDLIAKIDDIEGTAIYCDPPYLVKGSKYIHDFQPADHLCLAEMLHRFQKSRVVVSYYDHPRLAELYPGWTKLPLEHTKAMVQQGQRGKEGATKAPEVLLLNGPVFGAEAVGLW